MIASIDRKLSMGELRKEFNRIYPTVKHLHMNIIAAVMFNTDFKMVQNTMGIYYDFYAIKHITNSCKSILGGKINK